MNELVEKIISRHAIRRYLPKQVELELVEQIVAAGLHAPSAGNGQGTKLVVCRDVELNAQLGKVSRLLQFGGEEPTEPKWHVSDDQPSILDDINIKDGFYGAPTVITIFSQEHGFIRENAAMVAENMMLAAHFLGLGSCYIGRAKELFEMEYPKQLQTKWGIPENYTAIGHVLVGYRDGAEPKAKPRKDGRVIYVG